MDNLRTEGGDYARCIPEATRWISQSIPPLPICGFTTLPSICGQLGAVLRTRVAGKPNSLHPIFDLHHRAHVTTSIITSAAFLEAAVNELYADAADHHLSYIAPLTREERVALADFWDSGEERRTSVLEKYETALRLLTREPLARGSAPYQDVALLMPLRNELVHFRPASREAVSMEGLHSALSSRFPRNPLMAGQQNPYFPDHCLGSGCAQWSVRSALSFAAAFFDRIGVSPNYQRLGISTATDM